MDNNSYRSDDVQFSFLVKDLAIKALPEADASAPIEMAAFACQYPGAGNVISCIVNSPTLKDLPCTKYLSGILPPHRPHKPCAPGLVSKDQGCAKGNATDCNGKKTCDETIPCGHCTMAVTHCFCSAFPSGQNVCQGEKPSCAGGASNPCRDGGDGNSCAAGAPITNGCGCTEHPHSGTNDCPDESPTKKCGGPAPSYPYKQVASDAKEALETAFLTALHARLQAQLEAK